MPSRTCYLHAGGHRTGTTALQQFLRENRETLAVAGYFVPRENVGQAGAHHVLLPALAGEPLPPAHRGVVEDFQRQVVASNAANIILSSESAEATRFNLARVVASLRDMGFAVVLVYYVRPQPQLLNSRYMNQAKALAFSDSFSEYVARTLRQSDYAPGRLLSAAEQAEIKTVFRPYNDGVAKPGIVQDFLAAIGAPDHAPAPSKMWVNKSLGPVAVHAARQIVREFAGRGIEVAKLKLPNRRGLTARIIADAKLSEPAYCGLSTELARRIEDHYAAINDAFSRRVWSRPWADVFPETRNRCYMPNDLEVTPPDRAQQRALEQVSKSLREHIEKAVKAAPAAITVDG